MAIGQVLGAYMGSHLAIKKGFNFIRPIFICITFILTIYMFYKLIYIKL